MSSLYETLGVDKAADSSDIRRAYLKLSKTEHPDKGGSAERFKTIQNAYEILSDEQKRSYYDQTGQIQGEEVSSGNAMPFPFDLGAMFGGMGFGGGGGPFGGMNFGGGGSASSVRQKRPKAPSKTHEISLSLREYFV